MNQEIELKIIEMSEVESKEISWLWYPFIPYGKLTIIQGDPGDGKTTLVLNIAAALSKGERIMSELKNYMMDADDVAKALSVSKGQAYKTIRILNEELKAQGYFVVQGKVPKAYWETKFYGFHS